jgi:hypothetical protein
MRKTLPLVPAAALAALLCLAAPAHAAGTVEVKYMEPQKFTDVGFGAFERERTLKDMTAVLQQLGKQLADGQVLQLEVTDIDLAGEVKFTSHGDLRVMKGRADWPRIKMRYTLVAGGTTLQSGEAEVSDMAYLTATPPSFTLQGPLAYEQHMLRRWMAETFGPAH